MNHADRLDICGQRPHGILGCPIAQHQISTGTPPRLPTVSDWLRHADATLAIIRDHYGHLEGKALANAAAEENVLVQLEHLRTLPIIASRTVVRKVRLHGWMYKIETGEVFNYDSDIGQFVKFGISEAQRRA